ncbi:E3 ubiquitin-protein ligase RBBP6 [Sarcoptes scabiei]|uniref:E3 ubiquitin-protein ligase RBBP6 n=1 Tax=Sarcoptes scabiei TaxID=52283 RepID=A0A834RGT5_SARSC|nr:E3 ubiquitin-protein ligase RBBP6 [Sarcoptes scabiei]
MLTQSTKDYDPNKYAKGRGPMGPLPPNYTCYRCGNPDIISSTAQRIMYIDVKRSTGIPRSFMIPANKEQKGAMITANGEYAVPLIDHVAYKEIKKEKPPFAENENEAESELKSRYHLIFNVHLQESLAGCRIRTLLLESDNHECPSCHEINVSPNDLIPNRFLRISVGKFKNESGYQNNLQKSNESKSSTIESEAMKSEPIEENDVADHGSDVHIDEEHKAETIENSDDFGGDSRDPSGENKSVELNSIPKSEINSDNMMEDKSVLIAENEDKKSATLAKSEQPLVPSLVPPIAPLPVIGPGGILPPPPQFGLNFPNKFRRKFSFPPRPAPPILMPPRLNHNRNMFPDTTTPFFSDPSTVSGFGPLPPPPPLPFGYGPQIRNTMFDNMFPPINNRAVNAMNPLLPYPNMNPVGNSSMSGRTMPMIDSNNPYYPSASYRYRDDYEDKLERFNRQLASRSKRSPRMHSRYHSHDRRSSHSRSPTPRKRSRSISSDSSKSSHRSHRSSRRSESRHNRERRSKIRSRSKSLSPSSHRHGNSTNKSVSRDHGNKSGNREKRSDSRSKHSKRERSKNRSDHRSDKRNRSKRESPYSKPSSSSNSHKRKIDSDDKINRLTIDINIIVKGMIDEEMIDSESDARTNDNRKRSKSSHPNETFSDDQKPIKKGTDIDSIVNEKDDRSENSYSSSDEDDQDHHQHHHRRRSQSKESTKIKDDDDNDDDNDDGDSSARSSKSMADQSNSFERENFDDQSHQNVSSKCTESFDEVKDNKMKGNSSKKASSPIVKRKDRKKKRARSASSSSSSSDSSSSDDEKESSHHHRHHRRKESKKLKSNKEEKDSSGQNRDSNKKTKKSSNRENSACGKTDRIPDDSSLKSSRKSSNDHKSRSNKESEDGRPSKSSIAKESDKNSKTLKKSGSNKKEKTKNENKDEIFVKNDEKIDDKHLSQTCADKISKEIEENRSELQSKQKELIGSMTISRNKDPINELTKESNNDLSKEISIADRKLTKNIKENDASDVVHSEDVRKLNEVEIKIQEDYSDLESEDVFKNKSSDGQHHSLEPMNEINPIRLSSASLSRPNKSDENVKHHNKLTRCSMLH